MNKMTQRSIFYQTKIEMKARFQVILAKLLFSKEETLLINLFKKLLRFDQTVVNDDPDLEHPKT